MAFPEMFKSDEDVLQAFKVVIPYINQIVREDVVIGLTNLTEYIDYVPGKKLDIKITPGMPISNIPTIQECIKYDRVTYDD